MIEKATGLFILLSTFLGTILLNSKLGHFFDVPSFLLVFLPLLILYFFKSLIKPSAMNDIQKGNELSHYELIGSTSLQLGLLGGIFGFVLMFLFGRVRWHCMEAYRKTLTRSSARRGR